jgi:acetylornithine deacetylase
MRASGQAAADVDGREIADAVAAESGYMEDVLCRLVAAPTTLGNEDPGQEVMREALRELGLEPVDLLLDETMLRSHPAASPFSWELDGKCNVVADWRPAGESGRSLVLNGHIDVVSAGAGESLWRSAPFIPTRDGDWLYGRGAGDMKGGLAAILGAVRALRGLGLAPLAPVQLQSVVEEECTGSGALQCAVSGLRADACVIAEPFPGAVSVSQVGVLWFHVDVAGLPAHAGDAQDGANAIEASFPIVAALRRLEAELNEAPPAPYDTFEHPINLNIGVMRGGDWPSTVAAECTLSCRLALYPGQDVSWLEARVEEAVARAAGSHPFLAAHPPRVRYDGFACAGAEIAVDDPLVTTLAGSYAAVAGALPELVPTTATTDARQFLHEGIPAVCIGPWAENVHAVDERVNIPSMIVAAQTLALFVRDWCGLAEAAA